MKKIARRVIGRICFLSSRTHNGEVNSIHLLTPDKTHTDTKKTIMKYYTIPSLALALILGASGCSKLSKTLSEKGDAAAPAVSDQDMSVMGHYAEGFNTIIGKPHECITEYMSKVPEDGPEAGKKYQLFPRHNFASSALDTAKKQFAEAKKDASSKLEHLGPLADAALADLEQIVSTFGEVHKYYDAENFKDDEGKKGKELHEKMVKLAGSYQANMEKLENALSEVERQQTLAELKKYEKDKSYSYWFRAFNFEANQLLKAVDKARYEKSFAKLEEVYASLKGFADGKGDQVHASFKAYMTQVERFHSLAVKASRTFAESPDNAEAISKHHDDLIGAYNTLISVSNSMQQLEANDLLK